MSGVASHAGISEETEAMYINPAAELLHDLHLHDVHMQVIIDKISKSFLYILQHAHLQQAALCPGILQTLNRLSYTVRKRPQTT